MPKLSDQTIVPSHSNAIEAANRAEVTALLIRAGYRVYRPEADIEGEDLVVRTREGQLLLVQLKSRMTVDETRYGGQRKIWMLFPDRPFEPGQARSWYLVPHDLLFEYLKGLHGHTPKWSGKWSSATPSRQDKILLSKFLV